MMEDIRRPKVVIVGMLDSPHLGRWLATVRDLEADFYLFPSTPNRKVLPMIKELETGTSVASFDIFRTEAKWSAVISVADLVLGGKVRARFLRRRLDQIRPDLVHALELQHAGYALATALKGLQNQRPKVALTNYGSDLFWFRKFPSHERRLRDLLQIADVYAAECQRDLDIAKSMGFSGHTLSVLPTAGGVDLPSESIVGDVQSRRLILIKGYTNFVGRAQDVLSAVARRSREFDDWEIVVYSATLRARVQCAWITRRHRNLNLRTIAKKKLSHREMLELFGMAAAYLGFSRSDGISTSFLEALTFGAYPLQTSTACIDEWRARGAEFASLNVDDPEEAVDLLLQVLNDHQMRERAASANRHVAEQYLNVDDIAAQYSKDYSELLGR